MKKIAVVTLIVAILGTGLFVLLKEKKSGIKFRTEKVVKGEIEATVTATGTVNPVTTVLVGTQVSGTIKHLYADFNSPVRRGQVLAQLDSDTFESQVAQAAANLQTARAQVDNAKASLENFQAALLSARAHLASVQANAEKAKVSEKDAK